MEIVQIEGTVRTELGKKAAKAYKSQDLVLCNLYAKDGNVLFTAPTLAFRTLVYTSAFRVAEIQLEGKSYRAIVKEIQFDPVTDRLIHIDFLPLTKGDTFVAEVPLKLEGSSIGVKAGGKLVQQLRKVKIKTRPENMVSEVSLDITHLDLGKSARIRDIKPIEGVEILNSPSIPVVLIEIPRALRSAQAAAAATDKKKKK